MHSRLTKVLARRCWVHYALCDHFERIHQRLQMISKPRRDGNCGDIADVYPPCIHESLPIHRRREEPSFPCRTNHVHCSERTGAAGRDFSDSVPLGSLLSGRRAEISSSWYAEHPVATDAGQCNTSSFDISSMLGLSIGQIHTTGLQPKTPLSANPGRTPNP